METHSSAGTVSLQEPARGKLRVPRSTTDGEEQDNTCSPRYCRTVFDMMRPRCHRLLPSSPKSHFAVPVESHLEDAQSFSDACNYCLDIL